MCRLKDQRYHIGTYMCIQLQEADEDPAFARVKDIRVPELSRWLLLLAWLQQHGDYWSESNHLQIVLCDTVNNVLRPAKIAIRSQILYDASCSRRLLGKRDDLQKWQAQEQALLASSSS